ANRGARPNSSKWVCCIIRKKAKAAEPPWLPRGVRSDPEAFAAAALVLDVGIIEPEPFIETLAGEIEFRAVDIGEALGVDKHLDAVALEDLVPGVGLIDILELVRETRTAGGAHAKAQSQTTAAALDVVRDVAGGLGSQ